MGTRLLMQGRLVLAACVVGLPTLAPTISQVICLEPLKCHANT